MTDNEDGQAFAAQAELQIRTSRARPPQGRPERRKGRREEEAREHTKAQAGTAAPGEVEQWLHAPLEALAVQKPAADDALELVPLENEPG